VEDVEGMTTVRPSGGGDSDKNLNGRAVCSVQNGRIYRRSIKAPKNASRVVYCSNGTGNKKKRSFREDSVYPVFLCSAE
jgi:hypothetical protein